MNRRFILSRYRVLVVVENSADIPSVSLKA